MREDEEEEEEGRVVSQRTVSGKGAERVVRGLYPANGTLGVFPKNPLVFII